MSTLCRANWKCRNVRGAPPSRSLCGASRPVLPVKDVFGGTPNTARETHALPIHRSALLNDPQGNQTERVHGSHSPDDFFCPRRIRSFFAPFLSASALAAADALGDFALNSGSKKSRPSHRVAVSRSDLENGSGKTYEPFVPFRGHSVIVNPSDRSGIRQSVKAGLPAVAVTAKAGQTAINLVKYKLFGQDDNQIISKYFKVNDLQNE